MENYGRQFFFPMFSNTETIFLFQFCISNSEEDYTFHAPSLNLSHCPVVHFLKIHIPYEDAATSYAHYKPYREGTFLDVQTTIICLEQMIGALKTDLSEFCTLVFKTATTQVSSRGPGFGRMIDINPKASTGREI